MKVAPLRSATGPAADRPGGLVHAVAFHQSPAELVARLAALARPALEAGGTVALALAPATAEALRSELGRAGSGGRRADPTGMLLDLPAPGPVEARSGQTVALARARELRALAAVGPVTVLTEHLPELDGPDGRFWTELEAASAVAMADLPVRMTCLYPELPLHLAVLDGARCTHPHLLVGDGLRPNPVHRPPRELLAAHPVAAPELLGVPEQRMAFRSWQLRDVRRMVRDAAVAAGFGHDRADDVVLAVNEVATNAVEHGGPRAELHLWRAGRGLVCEVHDTGPLADPLPGLVAPHAGETRGRGLWIARQLCELLHVWTDSAGTHVRIAAAA